MKTIYLVIYEHPQPSKCWVAVHDDYDAGTKAWRQFNEAKTQVTLDALDGIRSEVRIAAQSDAFTFADAREAI